MALEDGADLVLAINPVVPIDVKAAVQAGTMAPRQSAQSGYAKHFAQTYRTMVYSRMRAGMVNV